MRRRIVSAAMLVLLAASPSLGQQLGNFDGAFCLDTGLQCNAGSGFLGLVGWALASTGVKRVIIQVDGVDLGRADYGALRPDVTVEYPGFPDSALPGWSYNLNTTLFENGIHQVSAKVETVGGGTFFLHSEDLVFTNTAHLLEPFGEIDSPGPNEDLFGTCSVAFCGDGLCEPGLRENCLNCPFDCNGQQLGVFNDFCCGDGAGPNPLGCDDPQPPAVPGGAPGALVCQVGGFDCNDTRRVRYTVVRGWALDLGLTQEDTGISWVELETNGAIVGNTRTSCTFDPLAGGLTNCYGLPRLDLEARFPFVLNAPSAGYRFVLDVGALIVTDQAPRGSNLLTVRAGDWSNQHEDVDDVPVNFFCAEEVSEPAFGRIESPRKNRLYSGLLTFEGWALDGEGVVEVEVFVDGKLIPGTMYGAGLGTRPLVESEYPGFQDTEAPVWRLEDFDTTELTNGEHMVQVQVIDGEGHTHFIGGEVPFRVENPD